MFSNLKTQIKDLQKLVENKEVEISELKKNSRATKMQEAEVEIKMYIDECTRLRRLLQEAYFQLGQGINPPELQQKYVQQCLQIKALKKEYKELVSLTEEAPLNRSKSNKEMALLKLKKNLLTSKEEILRVSEDNQRLAQELSNLRTNFRCQNCGFVIDDNDHKDVNSIVWDIWQAIEHRKLEIEQAWHIINFDNKELISKDDLSLGLEKLGLYLTPFEVSYFFPNNTDSISSSDFQEIMTKLRPADLISFFQVEDTLFHLSYRLQVRRFEYNQVCSLFFADKKIYTQMEVYTVMQQDPIFFTELQSELFTKFLFGSSESLSQQECIARFYEIIPPWQVLTEDEESLYDVKLREIVQKLGETLIKSLQVHDTDNSGFINSEKFYDVLERCKIEVTAPLKKYLDLLFYTDQMEFDKVPYKNFYQAYSSQS